MLTEGHPLRSSFGACGSSSVRSLGWPETAIRRLASPPGPATFQRVMSGRPASADSRQSGASLTTSPIARPRTTAGVRRPPRRPPVAPNSAPDNSRGGGRRGGRMAMSASGPMPASFSSGHNPLRTGRSMRPRTASGTAMWGQSFAATAGGSFMTQSLMDDDSNSTLPLFVDLGSPRPEDRIQTQRQMRMFEVMSRQCVGRVCTRGAGPGVVSSAQAAVCWSASGGIV